MKIEEGFFEFEGYQIANEFKDICERNKNDIIHYFKKREEKYGPDAKPFRFVYKVNSLIKKIENTDLYSYMLKHNYEKYLCDLFYMSPTGYKNIYEDIVADWYDNLSDSDKDKTLQICDYGARSIFQARQDTVSSNVFEDLIARHSGGLIEPNEKASGRNDMSIKNVSTLCDFVYDKAINLELKTNWSKALKEEISLRGSGKKIKESNGVILVINPYACKYALLDTTKPEYSMIDGGNYGGKSCDTISVSSDVWKLFYINDIDNSISLINKDLEIIKKERGL